MEFVLLDDLQAYGACHEYVVVAAFSCAVASAVGQYLIVNHFIHRLVVTLYVGLVADVGNEVVDCFVFGLDIGVKAGF